MRTGDDCGEDCGGATCVVDALAGAETGAKASAADACLNGAMQLRKISLSRSSSSLSLSVRSMISLSGTGSALAFCLPAFAGLLQDGVALLLGIGARSGTGTGTSSSSSSSRVRSTSGTMNAFLGAFAVRAPVCRGGKLDTLGDEACVSEIVGGEKRGAGGGDGRKSNSGAGRKPSSAPEAYWCCLTRRALVSSVQQFQKT